MSSRGYLALFGCVAGLLAIWMLGTPETSGPDEPDHQVRAAALVRGQIDGESGTFGIEEGLPDGASSTAFELPARIGFPNPRCYIFVPWQSASCTIELGDAPDETLLLPTRSANYPIWGHLPAGLGTFAPSPFTPWTTRLADGLIPAGLIAAALALALRRGWMATGSFMLAATPMVWFVVSVTNPSGLVIAGGFGLWAGLFDITERSWKQGTTVERSTAWLVAASVAAMVLPRRDGMFYAMLIIAFAIMILGIEPRRMLRELSRWPLAVMAAATVATLAWATTTDVASTKALFVTPVIPVAALVLRQIWRSTENKPWPVIAGVLAVGAVVGTALNVLVMSLRGNGFDSAILKVAVQETDGNLAEVIGNFGWLDTPLPQSALYFWLLGFGILLGVGLMVGQWKLLVGAAGILGSGIVLSWTLTMLQNDSNGLYWQGRYYLPLLIGAPLVLGLISMGAESERRVGIALTVLGLGLSGFGLAVSMRRFGVGTGGSLSPTSWDTYGAPLPPVLLLAGYVVLAAVLFGVINRQVTEVA